MHALGASERGLSDVPMLLRKILSEELWRSFHVEQTGEEVKYVCFVDFVVTKPLEGLGADLDTLKRLCAGHQDVIDLIDRAEQGKHGGDRKSERIKRVNHSLDTSKHTPRTSQLLRRLRKDYPELHGQVLKGKITVNEGAIRAGIYPSRVSINTRSPASAAASIIKVVGKVLSQNGSYLQCI